MFLIRSYLYHILTMSQGILGIVVFTFMRMICRSITVVLCRTFKGELKLDLQRVHEWAAANDFKLNPMKSQVIVIIRCKVDIPPPTLQDGPWR
jgi:hypothetical protein